MNEHTIAIFCICDKLIKAVGFTNNFQQKMNDAEVMSFTLISALFRTEHTQIMCWKMT